MKLEERHHVAERFEAMLALAERFTEGRATRDDLVAWATGVDSIQAPTYPFRTHGVATHLVDLFAYADA